MNLDQSFFLFNTVFDLPWSVACAFTATLGAIIGSFLNVVIHRLPREESIVFPNSRCPACAMPIRAYDNIPIISWLALRGRCRACRAPISARYPLVEALTALLYAAVFWRDGLSFALPFDLAFVTALIALIFIDAEQMILPNAITYPGIVFALLARISLPYLVGAQVFDDLPSLSSDIFAGLPVWAASLGSAAIGAIAGGGSLWLMGWLWQRVRGVEAMGLGDVKMMFMVGAYMGWRLTVVTIFLAAVSGSVIGILMMLRRGEKDMQMLLPFGIFLGIGSILALLFGTHIVTWYAARLGL